MEVHARGFEQARSATRFTRAASTSFSGLKYVSELMKWSTKVEQSQRALDLGQAFGAHMQIASGGVQRGVAQEHLDDGDFDPVLQAMGSETVTQAMNAAAVGQFGFGHGAIEDALAGALVEGLKRLDAREEVGFGLELAVVVAQHAQEVLAQQGVTLTSTFGVGHQQPMACAIEVLDANVSGFREAQATAIDATEEGPGAQVAFGAEGEEFFDFGHAIEARSAGRTTGALDAMQEWFDILLEHLAVEGAHGIDGQVDGGRGLLALG